MTNFDRYDYSTSTSSYSTLETSTVQIFDLDELGNSTSVTTGGTSQARTTNLANELTGVGSLTLTYDNNGNTTTDDQGHTLVYDAWNRLVAVENSGTSLEYYTYDALGNRISVTALSGDGTVTTDQYFSGSGQLLDSQIWGTTVARYVWGAAYINELVVEYLPSDGSLIRNWVEQDANWNVISVTDDSGNVLERYRYTAYGEVTFMNASGTTALSGTAIGQTILFQGMRFDITTNLYSTLSRDYSATMGRWMSMDPMGYAAGDVNLYRTEGDNPVDEIDPSGLSDKTPASNDAQGSMKAVLQYFKRSTTLPGKSQYWVGIFSSGDVKDPCGDVAAIKKGHVWIVLLNLNDKGTITARGLIPADRGELSNSKPEGKGKIRDEIDQKFSAGRLIPITKEEYDKWIDWFKKQESTPPNYNLRSNNCTNFALNAIPGVKDLVPESTVNFGADDTTDSTEVKNPASTALELLKNNLGYPNSVAIDGRPNTNAPTMESITPAGGPNNTTVYTTPKK